MKITSSLIGMESERTYTSFSTRKLSLVSKKDEDAAITTKQQLALNQGSKEEGQVREEMKPEEAENRKKASDFFLEKHQANVRRLESIRSQKNISDLESIRQQCVVYLWAVLFGREEALDFAKRYQLDMPSDWEEGQLPHDIQNPYNNENAYSINYVYSNGTTPDGGMNQIPVNMMKDNAPVTLSPLNETYAVRETFFTESEETHFSTKATVKTADGREINFQLNLNMSRSFSRYTRETADSMAAFTDPLVINLGGNIASVTDQTFLFDLDCDGQEDKINVLSEESGYLALDHNGDGIVNDGSELFGPGSGDGFADLSLYDEDGNGWIDENDDVWHKLKIWIQNPEGESQLLSLKETGVGALCLGKADTEFMQRDSRGQVSAAIRSTGVFLYENGMAGTLQHLDLAQHYLCV